jgi:ubiquinone/menaquinone biosynthesis C-methylase UbiE
MMCLCSIPTPEKLIPEFYPLLKPGGQILIFEHVASEHPFQKFVQDLYTNAGWRFILDGCELNRPTQSYLIESGKGPGKAGWKEVDLKMLPDEGWWSVIPHAIGKLVKA